MKSALDISLAMLFARLFLSKTLRNMLFPKRSKEKGASYVLTTGDHLPVLLHLEDRVEGERPLQVLLGDVEVCYLREEGEVVPLNPHLLL